MYQISTQWNLLDWMRTSVSNSFSDKFLKMKNTECTHTHCSLRTMIATCSPVFHCHNLIVYIQYIQEKKIPVISPVISYKEKYLTAMCQDEKHKRETANLGPGLTSIRVSNTSWRQGSCSNTPHQLMAKEKYSLRFLLGVNHLHGLKGLPIKKPHLLLLLSHP